VCWGWIVKEARFCQRDSGQRLFCEVHRSQFKAFGLGAVVAILLNYTAAQIPPLWPAQSDANYTSQDFQIRLWVFAAPNTLVPDFKAPPLIEMYAKLGEVSVDSAMALEEKPVREYPSTRNPNQSFIYANRSTYVDNLKSLKQVRNLIGQPVIVRLPTRLFRAADRAGPKYYFECTLRGERMLIEIDQSGLLEGKITKGMFNNPRTF